MGGDHSRLGPPGSRAQTFQVGAGPQAPWLTELPDGVLAKHDSSRSTFEIEHWGQATPVVSAPTRCRS